MLDLAEQCREFADALRAAFDDPKSLPVEAAEALHSIAHTCQELARVVAADERPADEVYLHNLAIETLLELHAVTHYSENNAPNYIVLFRDLAGRLKLVADALEKALAGDPPN